MDNAYQTKQLLGHMDDVIFVAFASDTHLLTASADSTVRFWPLSGGSHAVIHKHADAAITSLALHRGLSVFLIGDSTGNLTLRNLSSPHPLLFVHAHTAAVLAVAIATDGSAFASAAEDGAVAVWNGQTGASIFRALVHDAAINSLRFAPLGLHRLLTTSCDSSLNILSSDVGATVARFVHPPPLARAGAATMPHVWCLDADFSPDARYVAASFSDCYLYLLAGDTLAPIIMARTPDWGGAVAFHARGDAIAVGADDGSVTTYAVPSLSKVASLKWVFISGGGALREGCHFLKSKGVPRRGAVRGDGGRGDCVRRRQHDC
jgi:WD40 repeat protein